MRQGRAQPISRDDVTIFTEREGRSCWSWRPTLRSNRVIGATTYVTYRDDDGDGDVWVRIEEDRWDEPEMGLGEEDIPFIELKEAEPLSWFVSYYVGIDELPQFSFLKLRALGCTDVNVLRRAREFDSE